MTAESKPPASRPSRSRSGESRARGMAKTVAAKVTAKDAAAMSPADLVAGPCALPDAPLAMPQQVIEPARGLFRRLADATRIAPQSPAAPSAGADR